MRRGLLLTVTEPPPAMDEKFNSWYEEHLLERLAIPGFRTARRWACEQIEPGDADPHAPARALLLMAAKPSLAHFKAPEGALAHIYCANAA